jgi:ABC-2 type transport system permease protein
MMGKIIGIALVGLTQFLIWVFLTVGIAGILRSTVLKSNDLTEVTQNVTKSLMTDEKQIESVVKTAETNPG